MKEAEIISKLNESLRLAESSLSAARTWSEMLAKEKDIPLNTASEKASKAKLADEILGDEKIVEGIFDGQSMLDSNEKSYPVPANYASKSKLVEGDKLKLTIKPNGNFIYKQVEQTPRLLTKGRLVLDGNQYKVLAENGLSYRILFASVTFFRAEIGDELTVLIPEEGDAEWAAVENRIPQ